jgi:hypothetical protein
MSAVLALAFAVNRRPTRRPRRPQMRRGAWIAAAALMLAAMPTEAEQGSGGWGFAASMIDVVVVAAIAVLALVAIVRAVQGVRADPDDRLLIGAIGGIVAFAALSIVRFPLHPAVSLYPFAVAIGAAVARANGNLRAP